MMKVKLRQAIDSILGLRELASTKMSLKSCMKMDKIIDKCEKEINIFNKIYKEKYECWGEPSKEEGMLQIKEEFKDQFEKEVAELMDYEFDIETEKLSIDDLKNVELSSQNFRQLKSWLIEA